MMATERTLGTRIRALRKERGMQQVDLAHATGLRVETLSRLENDRYPSEPTARTLRDLATALAVSVEELRGEQ